MAATELIDVTKLKLRFDIHTSVKEDRLKANVRAASRRLKQWVGATLYAAVLADAAATYNDLSDAAKNRLDDLQDAESYLAMHFAVLGLNTQIRQQGLVAEEKTSAGSGANNETIIRLLNPQATAQIIELYLTQAEEMARPYKVDTIESGFAFVEIKACV